MQVLQCRELRRPEVEMPEIPIYLARSWNARSSYILRQKLKFLKTNSKKSKKRSLFIINRTIIKYSSSKRKRIWYVNLRHENMKIIVLHYFDCVIDRFVDINLNHLRNVVESAWMIFFPFVCSKFLKRFFSVFATACWCIQFCPLTDFWFWIFHSVMLIVLILVYRRLRVLTDGGGGACKEGMEKRKNSLYELTKELVG